MDYFNKTRTLVGMILILVVINIAALAALWLGAGRPAKPAFPGMPPGVAPKEFIERQLGFSDDQRRQFEILRAEHHQASERILAQLRETRKEYFDLVRGQNAADSVVARKAGQIGSLQSSLDSITFRHFRQIRDLCNDQQKARFDSVLDQMLEMLGRPPEAPQHQPPL